MAILIVERVRCKLRKLLHSELKTESKTAPQTDESARRREKPNEQAKAIATLANPRYRREHVLATAM